MAPLVGCQFHILPVYIIHFLTLKRLRPDFRIPLVNDDDIYGFDPSELPGLSAFRSVYQVWYFFCKPKNVTSKSPTSLIKRAAGAGYWKSTGRGSDVKNIDGNKIGWKRTLVYHKRERGPSKEIKTNWVMHEFYVADSPLYKENYVCCYIEKQPNKQSSVSTPGDGQTSSCLASESVIHNIEDTFIEVESLQLQSHLLISDTGNHVTENTSTKVAPQPVSSQNSVSDSRNHVADNTSPMVEPQQISSQNLVSDPGNHDAENGFSMVMNSMRHDSFQHQPMVDLPTLSSQYLVSGSGNQVAEHTCSMSGSSSPPEFGESDGYNVKKRCISTKDEDIRIKKPRVLFNDEAQSSHNVAFNDDISNRVGENNSPESQCDSISNRNHVAENIFSELQPLPSCNSVCNSGHHLAEAPEYTSKVDPLLHAKSSMLNGRIGLDQTSLFAEQSSIHTESHPQPSCDSISNSGHHAAETSEFASQMDPLPPSGPDQTSFFSLLSTIHPEKGSSYSSVTNGGYNVLDCPLGFEWEDYFNSSSALHFPG